MNHAIIIALGATLMTGCASVDQLAFHGAFGDAASRRANERIYRADVKACGRGPGAEWCRLAADDGNLSRHFPFERRGSAPPTGVIVYDASQCSGAFEHGLCQGRPVVRAATPICHGELIDGVCAGPTF